MKKLIFTLALVCSFGLSNASSLDFKKPVEINPPCDCTWVTQVKKVLRQTNADGTVTMLIIYHTVCI